MTSVREARAVCAVLTLMVAYYKLDGTRSKQFNIYPSNVINHKVRQSLNKFNIIF